MMHEKESSEKLLPEINVTYYNELTRYFLETLPENAKRKMSENVKKIYHGNESYGNGHYDGMAKEITLGYALNSTYFLEILAHEIAHAIGIEDEFSYIVEKMHPEIKNKMLLCNEAHLLCDHFSKYLIYGNDEFSEEFEKIFGKRNPGTLDNIAKIITETDNRYEKRLKEAFSDDPENVRLFFSKDARFLRI